MYNSNIKRIGDKTREWIKVAKQWKKDHLPLDNGCYICGLCGRFVFADEAELDHIIPRSKAPSRVLDPTNIQPTHYSCNRRKGSRYIEPKCNKEQYEFVDWLSNM